MRYKITIIVIIITFMLQAAEYELPPKAHYKRGKIILKDYTKYEGNNIKILPKSISFVDKGSNINQDIMLSEIEFIRVQDGTQVLRYFAVGALVGGLSVLLTPEIHGDPNSFKFGVGLTVSSGAIGSLIGLATPKWKTYYLNY